MKLRLPQRDPSERLNAKSIWDLSCVFDGEEKAVTRELFIQAHRAGLRRVGDVHVLLETLSPGERKTLLDKLRRKVGLKPMEPKVVRTANSWSPWQLCPVCGCQPVNDQGVPIPVSVKRWHCPAHVDQASAGDMDTMSSGIKLSPAGVPIPCDEGELAREQAEAAIREQRHREQLAIRKIEAARMAEEKRALDEIHRRETPPGVL